MTQTKFEINDIISGKKGNPGGYGITIVNNGFGIITRFNNLGEIVVDWYSFDERLENRQLNITRGLSVNPDYFEKRKISKKDLKIIKENNLTEIQTLIDENMKKYEGETKMNNEERQKKINQIKEEMKNKSLNVSLTTNLNEKKDKIILNLKLSEDLLKIIKTYACFDEPTKTITTYNSATGTEQRLTRYRISNLLAKTDTFVNHNKLEYLFTKDIIDQNDLTLEFEDLTIVEEIEYEFKQIGDLLRECFEIETWQNRKIEIKIEISEQTQENDEN